MSLRAVGGALLAAGNRLLAACCDICDPRFCNQSRDECGNVLQSCGPQTAETIGPCTPACVPPTDPCECGPETPCQLCYECVERKCVRIEDCCADGTPCPPCHFCENGVCKPCDPCSKCVDGECVPCGPCEECDELGRCVPCDDSELCINGVCVPKQYYCCYDSPEPPGGGPRTTSCRPATLTPAGQQNPCEHGAKSGPHNSSLLCQQNCERFKCAPDACGNNRCVQDPDGSYESYSACVAACGDPCDMPCSFAGASAPGTYAIDGCERDICVSYSATNGRPIRVQIYGPIMVNGCPQPGTRVVKVDSLWRCEECCDCPDTPPRSNDPRDCEGGAKGQVQWTKPRGVTSFEVVVLTACAAAYTLDIQACNTCSSRPDPGPCSCTADSDCAPDCICCDGECIKKDAIPQGKCCGPCDAQNPCPAGCACVDGKCVASSCEDCAAKINAGEYALDVEYPAMTFPPPDGDVIYGGGYFLRELVCGIAIDASATCDNFNAPEGPYFSCSCFKTWTWTIGCDEEGGPVITGSSGGEWESCGCNSDGSSFSEGPSNPLLCNPRNVTAPKPTVSIRKVDNPLP